jgi:hypothetical protein
MGVVAPRPGHFTPRERTPGTHWIGGWVGPRAVLDAVVKRKIPNPRRESNPRTPTVKSTCRKRQESDMGEEQSTSMVVSCVLRVSSRFSAVYKLEIYH